ncbi:hypothetical protein [Mycolicibacterium arenosum]|uniref:Uncharacterized protein n=1 Tax=Mycolicibacterium arenosum TaxID=2952157 RepID=A0ABT1M0I8_9MYCO|nr:hypothetical protein [Mycolicibacterium sp. CAU 1645]MCP9272665.1 hypothetical protein [Mycolicibacterium sp. CAU 1645]
MSLLPIPPIESATDPVASPADLQQRWRALMQELGFGERLLRFTFVGPDRRLVKILTDLEIGVRPPPDGLDHLMFALRRLLDHLGSGHTVAFLLTRPGRGGLSNNDRRWCAAVVHAADRHRIPIEPMFRANDENLVPLTPRATAA